MIAFSSVHVAMLAGLWCSALAVQRGAAIVEEKKANDTSRWVVDSCGYPDLAPEARNETSVAAVRCCTDAGGGSTPNPCATVNYAEAEGLCAANGMRLCSPGELGSACGTGCSFDHELVWTTAAEGAGPHFWMEDRCPTGGLFSGRLVNSVIPAGVRCCNGTGALTPQPCLTTATHEQAVASCAAANYRLCSAEELVIACGTGCFIDYYMVWTSQDAAPTQAPTVSPTESPTVSPTESPTMKAAAATSFGDPHIANLRGERFDILAPGDFVFLSIPRGAALGAGTAAWEGQGSQGAGGLAHQDNGGSLLRIVAEVRPLGSLCQEGLLFVTGLHLSGQWVLGGRVKSLSLSTSIQAKMEGQALKISLLQTKQALPPAGAGSGISFGSATVLRNLSASELAAEFGASAGMLELTDYEPKMLPGAVNQHVPVLLLKIKLGPAIAKVRMVHQREQDEDAEGEKKEEQIDEKPKMMKKRRPRFSNSLWLTVTGLEDVLKAGGQPADIGGILGFDDHLSAARPPQKCRARSTLLGDGGTPGGGGVHAMAALGPAANAAGDVI